MKKKVNEKDQIQERELPKLLEEETEDRIEVVYEGAETVRAPSKNYVGVTDVYLCAGLIVYDENSENILTAHLTRESISNNELTSELEHFRSTIDSKSVEAYIVDGNSDYNYVVEETQSSLTDFSHLSFDISIVDAEEGTEGSICLDRSDGELYDFRPSRETIEQHQERGPI